jgi:hypothetical protein
MNSCGSCGCTLGIAHFSSGIEPQDCTCACHKLDERLASSARIIARNPDFVAAFGRQLLAGEYMGEDFKTFSERISSILNCLAAWYSDDKYPKVCKCGGKYTIGNDEWTSRIRCDKCGDSYDM